MASINLRSLIDNVLHDTSDDLREQCNAANEAFAKRTEEMNDSKTKLENHLQKVWKSVFLYTTFQHLPISTSSCYRFDALPSRGSISRLLHGWAETLLFWILCTQLWYTCSLFDLLPAK